MTSRVGRFLCPGASASIAVLERGSAGRNPNDYQRALNDCGRNARQLEHRIETLLPELIVASIVAGPADTDAQVRSNELLVENVLPLPGIELRQTQPVLRAGFNGETWRGAGEPPAAKHGSAEDDG